MIRNAIHTLLGAIIAWWTSLPEAISALYVLATIDYATGVLAAIMNGETNSRVGWYGLGRKILTFLLLAGVKVASKPIDAPPYVLSTVALAFCCNELISITENCRRGGLHIPKSLTSFLSKTRERMESNDAQGEKPNATE